ncbi:alanine racemase [Hamadaea sp. NPDC050747]|uniref:alanine racemase n=1 Tax=Hamadaea sp. NPDC050747 TaxID=3155789 RepID=UPI0034037DC4
MKIPDEYVDWRTKGVWNPGPPVTLTEFAAARHNLFGGAFTWPVMVARRTAIEHNVRTLADYCERHGALFAPHGKTTMAPSLFQAQLAAGAWAITVATPNQALVCAALGVPRVLLANEVVDPVALRWLATQDTEILVYADSLAAVERLSAATEAGGHFRVLLEWGYAGGRTGCRTNADAVAVAQAVHDAPNLDLIGISSFEGLLPTTADAQSFLDSLVEATKAIAHLLPAEPLVTAGGSAYFDLVTATLGGQWLDGRRLRLVLRSGAYISHDDGTYRHKTPFLRVPGEGTLDAALEVWAQVLATPEPGLALLGVGKREAPYDEGLPVPLRVRRADGRVEAADGLEIVRLNDHHGHLSVRDEGAVAVGDLVCLGISHPCTAFDKWSVIPVVEDDYTVTELLRTYF